VKGDNLDSLSQELEVSAATLSPWRDMFLTNGLDGLKNPDTAAHDDKIGQPRKALGETALNEVHIFR
jgi:hypothetical protein